MSTAATRSDPRPMTLWRLEVARMVRTKRWLVLVGLYGFFGVIGPLTARYINEIIERFGGGVEMTAPPPTPAEGIAQFIGNAAQLGLLAVVVIAAGALAMDAKPELAAFLRTKIQRPSDLVVPRYVIAVAGAALGLVVGTGLAWALTAALIGPVPAGALVVGTLYGILYLAVAVAVVAVAAAYTKTQASAVLVSLLVLLVLPILGVIDPLSPWLPSDLLGAVAAMVAGGSAGDHVRAAAVALPLIALLLAVAIRRTARREL